MHCTKHGCCCRVTFRRVVIGLLVFVFLLYFLFPRLSSSGKRYVVLGRIERCVDDKLKRFADKVKSQNAFLYLSSPDGLNQETPNKYFLPYIGNGYIGVSLDGNHGVWLKGARGLDIPTDFNPLIKFHIKGFKTKGAIALDILDGTITNITCFQDSRSSLSSCVVLTQKFYVHRTRPGVLIQDVNIYNPTDKHIEVSVSQDSLITWASDYETVEDIKADKNDMTDSSPWYVGSKTLDNQVLLTVAGRIFSSSGILALPARKSISQRCITVFDYTLIEHDSDKLTISKRKQHNIQALKSVLAIPPHSLDEQHLTAWHKIWYSGFAISESKAPKALNADAINSTLYYIMSHVSSILQDITSDKSEQQTALGLLNKPESCYHNRHHTLQFSSLWEIGDTVASMNEGVDTHLASIEKYGCTNYVKAGAEGVLQAVLLSLGGLNFITAKDKTLHLEFNVDPADLHRDYQFRNLRFTNQTYLNLSVIVDESNYAVLHISSSSEGFYAADAALSEPIILSASTITLPVILTKPITSILYVSHDKNHLIDMKKVVKHQEKPVLAPAHDHRVIAMHKHGYSYGGLPVTFWILLITLILVFHFFLFKMVFNEFCRADSPGYRRRAFS